MLNSGVRIVRKKSDIVDLIVAVNRKSGILQNSKERVEFSGTAPYARPVPDGLSVLPQMRSSYASLAKLFRRTAESKNGLYPKRWYSSAACR